MNAATQMPSLEERLTAELARVDRFNEGDLHRALAPSMTAREFRQLVWRAREVLRKEKAIEYRATSARDGTFERASDLQKIARGARFHRTGVRKQRRALEIVRAADDTQLDDAARRRKEATEQRIEQSIVFSQAIARRRAKTV